MKKGEKLVKAMACVLLSALCMGTSVPYEAESNVDNIMSKMTLEEKIGQMITVSVENWNGENFTIMEPWVEYSEGLSSVVWNNYPNKRQSSDWIKKAN